MVSFTIINYDRERLSIDSLLEFKIQESIPVLKVQEQVQVLENSSKSKNKLYCERYAAHGFCSMSSNCPQSHDLDIILENLENLPRLKRPRLQVEQVEQVEETSLESLKFGKIEHSAIYDSYMTGYIFSHQILKNQELLETSKNKLYLIGKSRPLLIEKSRFSQFSKGHLNIKNQEFILFGQKGISKI